MKQLKNSLQLPKPIADTRKIQNKLMTASSDEKNLRLSYLSRLQRQRIPSILSLFKILFKSNALIKPKKICFTQIKATNIRNIFLVLMFQQLLANNITGCVIPEHDLAELRSASGR